MRAWLKLIEYLACTGAFAVYLFGIVLAKGAWSTFFTLWTPWGFYLVVEHVVTRLGWV